MPEFQKKGKDVSLFCWGAMVREAKTASTEMEKEGIDVEIIDLRTLSPLDRNAIITSVQKTGRAMVVHEAPKTCGLGAEIVSIINEKALLYLKAPVLRVTGQDIAVPMPKAEEYYIPSTARIVKGLKKTINF